MGIKGTIRSLEAASRRAERESRRRQRELEQRQKYLDKMQELERAQVAVFENRLAVFTSIHRECGRRVNWQRMVSEPAPVQPQHSSEYEDKATATAEAYRPSLVDKLMGQVNLKRADLERAVADAKEKDMLDNRARLARYEEEHRTWVMNRRIAEGVLACRPDAYDEAIRQLSPLAELAELGSSFTYEIGDDAALIDISFRVNEDRVVPRQTKSVLKSGKLSVKEMPKTQFWSLYQDYVCGAALRLARELFALLPVDLVIVTALGRVLNTHTGHMEEQPILSVAMPRPTIEALNFDLLDPSDSMENFVHNMKFYKTKGFAPVERLNAADFRHVQSGGEGEGSRGTAEGTV